MKIRINVYTVFYFLLVIPFLKPSSFVEYNQLDKIFDYWRIISMCTAIIFILINSLIQKRIFVSKLQMWMWLFALYMFLITILYESSIKQWVLICLAPTSLIYWLECWLKKDCISTIKGLYVMFFALVVGNFLTMYLFPDTGMYIDQYGSKIFLIGMRTRWTDVFFPTFGIAMLCYEYLNSKINKILSLLLILLMVYQLIVEWVATAILGILIIGILFLGAYVSKKKINLIYALGSSIIINVLVVFFRIQYIFSYLLTDILNKDIGLNSRTMIWDIAILTIKDKWLLGSGITTNTSFVPLYGGRLIAQGHSMIIQLLHDGGIVSVIIFGLVLFSVISKINNSKIYSVYFNGILIVTITLLSITEVYYYHIYIYIIMTVGLYFANSNEMKSLGKNRLQNAKSQ